jgi:hypothetical protein
VLTKHHIVQHWVTSLVIEEPACFSLLAVPTGIAR